MNSNYYFDLLREHLRQPFRVAFAYGSGVFKQRDLKLITNERITNKMITDERITNEMITNKMKTNKMITNERITNEKMIDFLVVVRDEDLNDWHRRNMKMNPIDYPRLGRLALNHTDAFKDSVFFVPDVRVHDRRIKYGVVGESALIRDLFTWDQLFLAGRLHKPALMLYQKEEDINAFSGGINFNLDSAMRVALLCSPNPSDFKSVLKTIVGLSYTEDPRKFLAESPHKVENILGGQLDELEAVYLNRFEELKRVDRFEHLYNLPFTLRRELKNDDNINTINNDINEALGRIVNRSAWRQILLGSLSTSPSKGFNYLFSKFKKRFEL